MASTFRYAADYEESLSMSVVNAVAQAHDEDVLEQDWIIANDINPEGLDALFQGGHLDMTLRFEADDTTVTITADSEGDPVIDIESHR